MQILFQKKSLILSIIFFIFSCFTFLFFYRSINNNEKISQLAQEELQTEVARRENTRSLINLIKTIGPERTLLEKHFVKGSDIVPFLDTIEKLAGEIRAKTEIISVNTAKDNS